MLTTRAPFYICQALTMLVLGMAIAAFSMQSTAFPVLIGIMLFFVLITLVLKPRRRERMTHKYQNRPQSRPPKSSPRAL